MPNRVSAVVIAEPEYARGQFVLIRADLPDTDRRFVWCGRSLGWLPFETTSRAFFRFFSSREAAEEAAEKYVTLPVQEDSNAM